jgi:hypothetical protein
MIMKFDHSFITLPVQVQQTSEGIQLLQQAANSGHPSSIWLLAQVLGITESPIFTSVPKDFEKVLLRLVVRIFLGWGSATPLIFGPLTLTHRLYTI